MWKNDVKGIIIFMICLLTMGNVWTQTNLPPTITAIGDQGYCPLNQINIVTSFNIVDPDNTALEAVFIQISTGYVQGEDILQLTGIHPTITSSWSANEGKLSLELLAASTNYSNLIAAVHDVVFRSNSATVSGEKYFSFTIDEVNYLPSTDHYYEYISQPGITWTAAKVAAEGRDYYGLQGYLATITSPEEAQLSGEQAAGAGWIGGSDSAVEGVWRWVTGPENGMIFWNGQANGSSPPGVYSNWNNGEPNQLGNEDYAHVTAPNVGNRGSWNDLRNTGDVSGDYQPKGYIVEYGGTPGDPVLNISANTRITVPVIVSTTPSSSCGPGTVTLSALASSGIVRWFDSPTSPTELGTGNNFTTPVISSNKTYYVLASANGCFAGERNPVVATIHTIPEILAVSGTTICTMTTGTLSASSSAGIINWYNVPTGGASLGTGNTFTTPILSATTTYYVDATENNCTTTSRSPITVTVQITSAPVLNSPQIFCDIENATIADLSVTGSSIQWYANATGGTPLNSTDLLVNNTIYYATQTVNSCESLNRTLAQVAVYETVTAISLGNIPDIRECDSHLDGDYTNGYTIFNLTLNEPLLLNGKLTADFSFDYFTDAGYTNSIVNRNAFVNTTRDGQTIYVRISNILDSTCFTDTSFDIRVDALPVILSAFILKNCDEDGTPDGYTNYNLNEANQYITGEPNISITYHLSFNDADNGLGAINPSPFNNANAIANTVYARIENTNGCYRVSTISLQVSTTAFPANYMEPLEGCDDDDTIDGLRVFDLTMASGNILNNFPTGQNLTVQYYRNLTDAETETNEILPQNAFLSETVNSQILYVRVESEDNGACWGIGPHLALTVHPRPEIEVVPQTIICLNIGSTILQAINPKGLYTYEWFDENNNSIGIEQSVTVSSSGTYTVIASSPSSPFSCESFPQTVEVTASNIAAIDLGDIGIIDDSNNNTIVINSQLNNLGIGDYEFALDDAMGTYQDEPIFEMVAPGIHTIYIRDKNGCGIFSLDVSVIGYPKFFTPNGDGVNDTWQVSGVSEDFYPTSLIHIFNRFGKLIAKVDPTKNGWNGIFNGERLPASDYWFTVQLIDDEGNIRQRKGHFSLIRR